MKSHMRVRALCEGAVLVAVAQILSYLKLWEMPWGGSVVLVGLAGLFGWRAYRANKLLKEQEAQKAAVSEGAEDASAAEE